MQADTLLCVGHEPTLSRLAGLLLSRDGRTHVEMRKSGVAVIDCPGSVAAGRGVLQMHLRPGETARLVGEGPAPPSPDLFMGTAAAYQRTAALEAALALDLFSAIGSGQETAADLASRRGASPRGVRILCDYLAAAGFLTKRGDGYALTADSAAFLDRASPTCIASAADFILSPSIRGAFADVAGAVRRGGTVLEGSGNVAPENPIWVRFAHAMAPMMRLAARWVSELVEVGDVSPLRVLDVAAGHGMYGIAFGQRYPKAEITGLDWPRVVEVALENARAAGLGARYRTIEGSAFEVPLGGPYELVLLPNFLHHFDPPTCERFLTRVHAALASGGRAVTVEFVPDEGRESPPHAVMFALVMLCTTPFGDAYTFSELDRMFRRAGFSGSELRATSPGGPQVIISRR